MVGLHCLSTTTLKKVAVTCNRRQWFFDIFIIFIFMFVEGHYEVAVNFDDQLAVPQFHLRMVSPEEVPKQVSQHLHMYLVTQPFKPVPHIMNLPAMLQEDNFLLFESLVAVKKPVMLYTFAPTLPAVAHIEFDSSVSLDRLVNTLQQVAIWLDSIVAFDGGSHNVARLLVSTIPVPFQDGMLSPVVQSEDVVFQWHAQPPAIPVAAIHQHPVVLAYSKQLEESPRAMSFRTRFPSFQRVHQEQTVAAAASEDDCLFDLRCLESVTIPDMDDVIPVVFGDFIVFMSWPNHGDTFVKTQITGSQSSGFPFELLNNEHVHLYPDTPFALFDDKTKTLRSRLLPASRFQYMSAFYFFHTSHVQKHVFVEHVRGTTVQIPVPHAATSCFGCAVTLALKLVRLCGGNGHGCGQTRQVRNINGHGVV